MTRSVHPMAVHPMAALAVLAALPLVSGCVARAVASAVTAPVRVAGKAVDLATTSQSEADEKRGREMRRRDERLGELERSWQRHMRDCDRGDEDACDLAREDQAEIRGLRYSD